MGGQRSTGTVMAALIAVAVLTAACGSEAKPAQEFFSRSDDVLHQLVPDARAFNLRLSSVDEESGRQVEVTASTALAGEPRMHVISDANAVAGADLVDEYEGFSIYRQKATLWAELAPEPAPLYAGTPSDEGLRAYVDFYRSGEPEFSDEQFQNGFRYARDRISEALQEAPSLLIVDFDGQWKPEAGGIRIEAVVGERRLYVGVLYAREGLQVDAQEFDQDVVDAFKQWFAVPPEAQEQADSPDWGYESRIWYADTATGAGEE